MRILTKDTVNKVGETVNLMGWVDVRRDHGKLIFIDLRDRWGVVQVVFSAKGGSASGRNPKHELLELADKLRPEWVISLEGLVKERPQGMQNTELSTGNIEIEATGLKILSEAKTPPLDVRSDGHEIGEETRIKYRYLDLRRSRLQNILSLRSKFLREVREFLYGKDFLEIETPMLTKSTPEGARDFVVPSRLHPGKFYALPQSPQQYKQLLMVAGLERYFQIARAMRDEDTRADRALEHTQIDLEVSFVEQKDVMSLVEEMITGIMEKLGRKIGKKPFPVFTYKEAMEKFGADKFDMRDDKKSDELAFAWVVDFPVFEKGEDGKLTYSHNPFTSPKPEDIEKLKAGKDLEDLVSLQYDLVCNGYELGSGSIRLNDPEALSRVFEIIGHKKEEIEEKFGHMLEAYTYGAPVHGGIALGVDRIIMILAGEEAMREVVAFPLTGDGRDLMMKSPSELTKKQFSELHLKIQKPKEK